MTEHAPHHPPPELIAAGRRLDIVDGGLAVSGAAALDDPAALVEAGIARVIDVREGSEFDDAGDALDTRLAEFGIARLNVPVVNFSAPSSDDLARIEDWLAAQQGDGRTLTHCQLGLGRGAALAIALLVRRGVPVSEAIERVRAARPEIRITDAQRTWLENLSPLAR